jgi:recombination protein RecA
MAKVSKIRTGKLSLGDIRKLINKKTGREIAHSLEEENPTDVKEWISTGSRWLDSIICKGKLAGVPVGKVTEIAGLEATGKSFMAAQIAANAQKMGMDVAYFDSESAIDSDFLQKSGCDLSKLIYLQAESVEFVLETIEELLSTDNKWLFIWDSLALTPSISDIEGDFNPQSSMAVKPRILSKGMSKLTVPIANKQATFVVLNQLKTNITRTPAEAMVTPWVTPGGKAMHYAYSLRVWLTGRKSKASYVTDDNGFRVGSEVKAKLEKSRFGTAGRHCNFKILWGNTDTVGIQDEESWFEAIQISERLKQSGAWFTLVLNDGTEERFQRKGWTQKLKNENFRESVLSIIDDDVIKKFKNREGKAEDFYESEKPEED